MKKPFHITNLSRAIHMWELLGQPLHAELLGHDSVEAWEDLLEEADKALKLAIADNEL